MAWREDNGLASGPLAPGLPYPDQRLGRRSLALNAPVAAKPRPGKRVT